MAQTNPTYEMATGKAEKPIIDELVRKYGASNVSWPIVLIQNDRIVAYLYEKTNFVLGHGAEHAHDICAGDKRGGAGD